MPASPCSPLCPAPSDGANVFFKHARDGPNPYEISHLDDHQAHPRFARSAQDEPSDEALSAPRDMSPPLAPREPTSSTTVNESALAPADHRVEPIDPLSQLLLCASPQAPGALVMSNPHGADDPEAQNGITFNLGSSDSDESMRAPTSPVPSAYAYDPPHRRSSVPDALESVAPNMSHHNLRPRTASAAAPRSRNRPRRRAASSSSRRSMRALRGCSPAGFLDDPRPTGSNRDNTSRSPPRRRR